MSNEGKKVVYHAGLLLSLILLSSVYVCPVKVKNGRGIIEWGSESLTVAVCAHVTTMQVLYLDCFMVTITMPTRNFVPQGPKLTKSPLKDNNL